MEEDSPHILGGQNVCVIGPLHENQLLRHSITGISVFEENGQNNHELDIEIFLVHFPVSMCMFLARCEVVDTRS